MKGRSALGMIWLLFSMCTMHKSARALVQETTPVVVLLDRDTLALPAAYFLASNSYQFIGYQSIDTLFFDHSCQFKIEKGTDNVFTIQKLNLPAEQYFLIKELKGTAIGHDGKIWKLIIPVKLLPPVTIDFFNGEQTTPMELHTDSIYWVKVFSTHARWEYPTYARFSNARFRGTYKIGVFSNDNEIFQKSGWNDHGDSIREVDLMYIGVGALLEICIDERSLKTLLYDGFASEFRGQKIVLSNKNPATIKVCVK